MHGVRFFSRDEFPGFIRREGQDWRQHLAEAHQDPVQSRLRRTSPTRIGGIGVKSILNHIVINGCELNGNELTNALIDGVELLSVVGPDYVALEF